MVPAKPAYAQLMEMEQQRASRWIFWGVTSFLGGLVMVLAWALIQIRATDVETLTKVEDRTDRILEDMATIRTGLAEVLRRVEAVEKEVQKNTSGLAMSAGQREGNMFWARETMADVNRRLAALER